MTTQAQRQELGALLRARRNQLPRAELGLPPVGRARTAGLRREEVAFLSGVSQTWYTWLEQGRDINPSRQVLDALARTLRLSPAEHAYVLSLIGYAAPAARAAATASAPPQAPAHLQRLLDHLASSPAFVLAPDWSIVGWNSAYAALYPNVATVAPADRNLLWLVFTDPYVQRLLPAWTEDSRRFLAEFRGDTGSRLSDPAIAGIVDRLQHSSAAFRQGWTSHDIEGFTSRDRLFHHPRVGDLLLEQHRLTPTDQADMHLIAYTPVEDGRTPRRLTTLLQPG